MTKYLTRFIWNQGIFSKISPLVQLTEKNPCDLFNFLFYTSIKFKNCRQKCSECAFGRYKYHNDLESEINAQINREQFASQAYLAMASYFGNVHVARHGCQKFFMKMYNEECTHAKNFIDYQLMRGGTVCIQTVQAPPQSQKTIIGNFETALKMEMDITKNLEDLVRLAEKIGDLQCADYVTSIFLKEQMESVNELSNIISVIKQLGNNEINLYVFDLDLQKKFS